jgi:signal transduction histidine kinase
MRIITENAVKYTKNKPCVIEMNISKNDGKVRIGIKDNGVGMPKEDVPHIFDRFFRGDKSRNKQIPGNGLGLSIAYSVVQKHNGKIWAESEQGKGSTFYLEFEEV